MPKSRKSTRTKTRSIVPERMVWTVSAMRAWRACHRLAFWKYLMLLRARHNEVPLTIGTFFHESIWSWYRGRRSSMNAIVKRRLGDVHKIIAEHNPQSQEEMDRLESELFAMCCALRAFGAHHANDRKAWGYKPKHIEASFRIDMGEFDFAGQIDMIAAIPPPRGKGADRVTVIDHKTASQIRESYLDRLKLDTQLRGYIYAVKHAFGMNPSQAMYDIVRKCRLRRKKDETVEAFMARIEDDYNDRPEFYFHREPLMYRQDDIDRFESELRQVHREFMLYASGEMGDPEDPTTWMANDSACDQYNRTCTFHLLCTTGCDRGTLANYDRKETMHTEIK